jgi:prostatic aicd phosphatase
LNTSSPDYIQGVNDTYLYNQIYAAAPYAPQIICSRNENVLRNTATAFLQGFYPPSARASRATLTNGTTEANPLDGYQYVLLNGMAANAPDAIWIKGDQFFPTMTNASNAYFESAEFITRQPQLQSFYEKFTPLLTGVFTPEQIGFQSAYRIFDYLNVGYVHNQTIYSNLTSDDLFQLRTLADSQELALVYNASSPDTSIGGRILYGAILAASTPPSPS